MCGEIRVQGLGFGSLVRKREPGSKSIVKGLGFRA